MVQYQSALVKSVWKMRKYHLLRVKPVEYLKTLFLLLRIDTETIAPDRIICSFH